MRLFITFASLLLATAAFSQDRALFDFNMGAAYDALSESDYPRALKFFKEAQKSPVLQQANELGLKMLVDELVPLVQKRMDLGVIKPSVRHKAALLWVEQIDGSFGAKKINQTLSDEDKRWARIRYKVVREIYEALSDGNFTIDFDEISITAPLTAIRSLDGKPWPDWNHYDGAMKIIHDNFDNYDTFIWCTNLIQGEAHGGMSRFAIGQGRMSPPRGFIELNPRFTPNMWMHEFFHVVEQMVGINPSHGHHTANKPKFPEWSGQAGNELNYYAWQFKTTIPAKGWDKLKIEEKLQDNDLGDDPYTYKTVGTWTPRQVTNDWTIQEWKIEDEKLSAGPVKIMMLYTEGWKALDIAWVAIWQHDKQIAMDEHFGFSGTKKRNIIYTLDVPEKIKGTFFIKAKVKGDNGTDSNGTVLMKAGQ